MPHSSTYHDATDEEVADLHATLQKMLDEKQARDAAEYAACRDRWRAMPFNLPLYILSFVSKKLKLPWRGGAQLREDMLAGIFAVSDASRTPQLLYHTLRVVLDDDMLDALSSSGNEPGNDDIAAYRFVVRQVRTLVIDIETEYYAGSSVERFLRETIFAGEQPRHLTSVKISYPEDHVVDMLPYSWDRSLAARVVSFKHEGVKSIVEALTAYPHLRTAEVGALGPIDQLDDVIARSKIDTLEVNGLTVQEFAAIMDSSCCTSRLKFLSASFESPDELQSHMDDFTACVDRFEQRAASSQERVSLRSATLQVFDGEVMFRKMPVWRGITALSLVHTRPASLHGIDHLPHFAALAMSLDDLSHLPEDFGALAHCKSLYVLGISGWGDLRTTDDLFADTIRALVTSGQLSKLFLFGYDGTESRRMVASDEYLTDRLGIGSEGCLLDDLLMVSLHGLTIRTIHNVVLRLVPRLRAVCLPLSGAVGDKDVLKDYLRKLGVEEVEVFSV